MENNTIKACEFTESCMQELKNIIHSPLYYTEVGEDGSRTLALSTFGESIYEILFNNYIKTLENE